MSSPENPDPADWLIGGGEMGRLVRAKDWSETPLGSIRQWPASLRTTVNLVLGAGVPIALAWGPRHTQIYNDAYRPFCADKHPASLGRDFTACWASALPEIGKACRRAMAGTAVRLEDRRLFLDRQGQREEAFFTFSFSPIRDESGQVVGLLHLLSETTAIDRARTALAGDAGRECRPPPRRREAPAAAASGKAGAAPAIKILVAEDSAVQREYLRTLLTDFGHEVVEAKDGAVALELMRSEKPDLLITDLLMPKLDGFELIRRIRMEPAIATTRIIVCSVTFLTQEAQALVETLGVARFVLKPTEPRTLRTLVSEVIEEPAPTKGSEPAMAALNETYRALMNDTLYRKNTELEEEVSRRKELEIGLRESEQRLSGIVGSAMDAIITVDAAQRIVLFNAAAEAMFGLPAAEAVGTPIERLIPERFRAAHERHVREFLAAGTTARTMGALQALRGRRADGDEFPIEAAISKVTAGGQILATVVVRDISARRATEQALQASEERLRLSQQVARIGSFEWDIPRDAVHATAEIKALYGLPATGRLDSFEAWCACIHPEDLPALRQTTQEALKNGRFDAEWRVVWPDGTVRWLAGRAEISHDAEGRPQRMLGVNIDITDRKEIEERIRQVALHDPLTGLPNRALIYEFAEHLLATMRREDEQAAFLFVDLDRFKPINDTYGHDVGDAVLKEVARRLLASVRSEDLVGRLGGDEFVAVLAHIHGEEDAAKVARLALGSLGEPYYLEEQKLLVSPSIGISLFPLHGSAVDELIKNADTAMFHAKDAGRNTFKLFRPELNEPIGEALSIESRLRKGIEDGEFVLFFQPVVDLQTRRIVSAEALIRWPAMQVEPERFIPVAETAGLMPSLGRWVLREACRQLGEWRDQGLPAFPLAVNVSPLQFRQADFTESIAQALAESGLAPGNLRIEVTEGTVMKNVAAATVVLQTLRRMGVKVAIDDFGTGYSSLSYLSRLPVDILKLDQSFVRDVGQIEGGKGNEVIAQAIIALAHSLGLELVAEGIETEAASGFLKGERCRHGQGFLYCRPLPARQFQEWCRRQAA